jgi:NAD-dependent oxidoreductase involved in siderophore biosynthesis
MQIKNDKLDLIASIFEGETFASFDVCCSDIEFSALLIENAFKPTDQVVAILVDHANQNLL